MVYHKLWAELQGAKNILLAAKKGSFPTSDLAGVVEAIDHHLDVYYREGAPLRNLTRRPKPQERHRDGSEVKHPNYLFREGWIAMPSASDPARPVNKAPDANVDLKRLGSALDDVFDFDDGHEDGEDEIKEESEEEEGGMVDCAFLGLGAELVLKNAESLMGPDLSYAPSAEPHDIVPTLVDGMEALGMTQEEDSFLHGSGASG